MPPGDDSLSSSSSGSAKDSSSSVSESDSLSFSGSGSESDSGSGSGSDGSDDSGSGSGSGNSDSLGSSESGGGGGDDSDLSNNSSSDSDSWEYDYTVSFELTWPPTDEEPQADMDLYVKAHGSETVYYSNLSSGGLTLNHEVYPGGETTGVVPPEIIDGSFVSRGTFYAWYNQYTSNAEEWSEHVTFSVTITNNHQGQYLYYSLNGGEEQFVEPYGGSVTLLLSAYAGYGTGAQPNFGGGDRLDIKRPTIG